MGRRSDFGGRHGWGVDIEVLLVRRDAHRIRGLVL
jgi:hypothetical protein